MEQFATLESAKTRGLALLADKDGWKTSSKSTEFCKIELKNSDRLNCSIFRSTQWMKAPMDLIKDTYSFMPGGRRKEWDSNVNEMTVVKQVNDTTIIYVSRTNGMAKGLISPREIINIASCEKTGEGYLLVGTSVDYPDIKVDDKFVRAITGVMIVVLEEDPSKPGAIRISAISEVDLKGKIPKYLLDTAVPGIIASSFNDWKKFMEKQGYSTP